VYRVLLITYYWPPAGGGGVQRWLKFTKYFRENGLEPVVYTPQDPDYPAVDHSLLEEIPSDLEVWRYPIWEPYHLYRKLVGKPKDEKIYSGFITEEPQERFSQKLSVFIRGNFFIPDARRFWIRPSVRYLSKRLKKEPVDLIISTGPPHSMHMIALGVTRRTGIPWIADFRDPWTGIDFYEKLRLTPLANWIHHRQERTVLRRASAVVTVSPYCVRHLEQLGGRKVQLITNGYDDADFSGTCTLTKTFTITHVGSINADRNPVMLWMALDALLDEITGLKESLQVRIIGPADATVMHSLQQYPRLQKYVQFTDWVDHHEAIRQMRSSHLLLLLINDTPHTRGLLPGKMFEYMGARRPVLCIGTTDGDAATLIRGNNAGTIVDFTDIAGIKSAVSSYFERFKQGDPDDAADTDTVVKYARRNLVKLYADLIGKVIRDHFNRNV
jgi:glycosyltransferase involved in cell wall biosynthesis